MHHSPGFFSFPFSSVRQPHPSLQYYFSIQPDNGPQKCLCSVKRKTRIKFPTISTADNSPHRSLYPPASALTGFGSICLASCCTIAEKPLKRRLSNIYNGWYFQSVLICCNSFCPLLEEWGWRVRLVNGLLCVKGIYIHLGSARSCFFK